MDNLEKHLLAKIGQYVLIENGEGKVLLLQRVKSKCWSLPGGRLDKNERDWKEALKREIKEEIDLDIYGITPFDIEIIEDPYQIKYCVFFKAKGGNLDRLNLSGEHLSAQWVAKDDLKEKILDDEPKIRKIIEKYFI